VPPFQGFGHVRIPIPRALPWADMLGPVGANSKTAQHQNARARREPPPVPSLARFDVALFDVARANCRLSLRERSSFLLRIAIA
jgi:hypothetical protein